MRSKFFLRSLFLLGFTACFFSVNASGQPSIREFSGELEEGAVLVLKGEGFTDKANGNPYFYWEADGGELPSTLGRNSTWERSPSGELSSAITAPNSSMAFRFDHGRSSGAALAGVAFKSEKLYVFRKTYEDFSTAKSYAIRTRITDLAGTIEEGQVVTGLVSGATGVVQSFSDDGENRWAVYYNNTDGSINKEPPVDFIYGERMETGTASFVNSEGNTTYPTGTFRTFNFKTIRLWNSDQGNNAYVGTGRTQKYDVIPEYTDGKLWNKYWDVPLKQRPFEWKSEELFYKSSNIGAKDGLLDFRFDNTKSYDHFFTTRDASRPDMYDIIYQSQVSNGAQPGSFIYYDHIYIDDSWHHVAICDSETWVGCSDKAIQVPISWTDSEISVIFDRRHFMPSDKLYFYVVDAFGNANPNGYPVCGQCPNSPTLFDPK